MRADGQRRADGGDKISDSDGSPGRARNRGREKRERVREREGREDACRFKCPPIVPTGLA
jgi:hypothetical protein